jgi:hypothetical protein
MVKGGITPASYSHRENGWIVVIPDQSFLSRGEIPPQFSSQFNLPWSVGAELAWNANCHLQFFLEYIYTHASGNRLFLRDDSFDERYGDYEVNSAYGGARHFFDRFCVPCIGELSPYVGFKAGVASQRPVNYTLVFMEEAYDRTYFFSQTVPSFGLQVGLEWWTCCCLSVVVQGEFVATCGPRQNRNVVVGPIDGEEIVHFNLGRVGWLVSWPVTLGLRYTF